MSERNIEAVNVEKERTRAVRKSQEGMVVSTKMDKTAVIAVTRQVKHPIYGKFVRRTKKYYAHDEANGCRVGDRVRIVETRPLSKQKRWRVQEVLVKAVLSEDQLNLG